MQAGPVRAALALAPPVHRCGPNDNSSHSETMKYPINANPKPANAIPTTLLAALCKEKWGIKHKRFYDVLLRLSNACSSSASLDNLCVA